jgi:hypothetical protein
LDAVPEGRDGDPRSFDLPRIATEPQIAAEVAKVFLERVGAKASCELSRCPNEMDVCANGPGTSQISRFSVYEEYGAKYELMIKDVRTADRMIPGWQSYQKGLEVLAASLASANDRGGKTRKSLTIADLLVKV